MYLFLDELSCYDCVHSRDSSGSTCANVTDETYKIKCNGEENNYCLVARFEYPNSNKKDRKCTITDGSDFRCNLISEIRNSTPISN